MEKGPCCIGSCLPNQSSHVRFAPCNCSHGTEEDFRPGCHLSFDRPVAGLMTGLPPPNRDSPHFAESMNRWLTGKRSLHCYGFREAGAHCLSRELNSAAGLGRSFYFLLRLASCPPLVVVLMRHHHQMYHVLFTFRV